ncbi:hypothetical protein ACHWQZ_G001365 [Mnemiopsis leidyi]
MVVTDEGTPISNTVELAIWITFNVIILLTTLLGDSLVLVGTIKYNAIKQHNVIVAIIQHLAVLDTCAALLWILPTIQVLITGRWELGEFLCHVNAQSYLIFVMMTPGLICLMSTLKLYIVCNPLKTATWSLKLGHKICTGLWILVLCLHIPRALYTILKAGNTIFFDLFTYNCYPNIDKVVSKAVVTWYIAIGTSLVIILIVVLMGTSLALLVMAKRAALRYRQPLRWAGVTTVLATVAVYLFSILPPLARAIANLVEYEISIAAVHACYQIMRLGIMTNFFVYCLTVKSFREFLKSRILGLFLMGRQPEQSGPRDKLAPLLEEQDDASAEDADESDVATEDADAIDVTTEDPTTTESDPNTTAD